MSAAIQSNGYCQPNWEFARAVEACAATAPPNNVAVPASAAARGQMPTISATATKASQAMLNPDTPGGKPNSCETFGGTYSKRLSRTWARKIAPRARRRNQMPNGVAAFREKTAPMPVERGGLEAPARAAGGRGNPRRPWPPAGVTGDNWEQIGRSIEKPAESTITVPYGHFLVAGYNVG